MTTAIELRNAFIALPGEPPVVVFDQVDLAIRVGEIFSLVARRSPPVRLRQVDLAPQTRRPRTAHRRDPRNSRHDGVRFSLAAAVSMAHSELIDVRTNPEWAYAGTPDPSEIGKTVVGVTWPNGTQLYPTTVFLDALRKAGV